MDQFQELINSEKPTLVDFFVTWCGPCKTMYPIIDQLKTKMSSQITILKVDVDKNQHAAKHYNVRNVPTFILFKKVKILWK